MGLAYIALSVACSLALAQVLKIAEHKKLNVLRILIINYLVAFLISFFTMDELIQISPRLINLNISAFILIFLLGIIFILNLKVYSHSIHQVGMGISFAAMRMSLVFPIAISLIIYGESIVWLKYAGIALALISLLLMIPAFKADRIWGISKAWFPILIFLMTGIADSGMKIYQESFSSQFSEGFFLGGVFLISFLIGFFILLSKKELTFSFLELFLGSLGGIVNLYASVFLINALKVLPGSVVFPLINVTLVVCGTLMGIYFWKDYMSKKQWIGLGMAIISIILLV